MTTQTSPLGRRRFWGVPIVLLCGAVVILVASFVVSPTWLYFMQEILVLGLFAVATNLIVGFGGLVSFGQAVFYGLGAYTLALGWLHFHAPFWLLLVLSPVIGALAALVIGALALRTQQWYFALLTLAFSQLFYTIANKWYAFTRGANGVFGSMVPSALMSPEVGLWFILGVTFVALLLLWAITMSPFGLTLRAIRENRHRAEALGVNLYRHQLYAFILSSAFCALAGALFVVHNQSAYPSLLDWTQSGAPILMAVIGGLHHFLGPLVGAIIFLFAHNYLVQHTHSWELILGIVFIAIVLFAPEGLLGLWHGGGVRTNGFTRLKTFLGAMFSEKKVR